VDFISAKFTARFVRDEPAETIFETCTIMVHLRAQGLRFPQPPPAHVTSIRDLQHLIACTLAPW
jgi:hypothetical protein